MYGLVTFVVTFCLIWGNGKALDEDVETDDFMNALCDPTTLKDVARCGEMLPPVVCINCDYCFLKFHVTM
ncbi:hypothetical protein TNCV_41841 [Trichonephila clavipes]|nr:hypothetical protein TNCV_41841 [Trichonephila clavipes]